MSSINFVPTKQNARTENTKIKRLVMTATTVILVIYLVAAGGFMGWWWLWSNKEQQASTEIEGLRSQITSYAETERLIRTIAERGKSFNDFLLARDSASQAAAAITHEGYNVIEWVFVKGGQNRVKVAVANPDAVNEYAKIVGPKYNKIQLGSLTWTEFTGWNGELLLTGRK